MAQAIFLDPVVTSGPTLVGTGNGTCSVDKLTHFTVPQTYTLTCLAVSPDTVFSVVGSLDGSVGIATAGVQYFDDELKIFLTITQGGTPFAVSDQFTIIVDSGTDLDQDNIDDYDELPQKNFGVGTKGTAEGDHNIRYSNTALAAYLYLQGLKFTAVAAGSAGNGITVEFETYTGAQVAYESIQGIYYEAVDYGFAGNSISIEYLGDGLAGLESVVVVGQAITVHLEGGVSTASQVLAAILASGPAMLLVNASLYLSGGTLQNTEPQNFLDGGEDAIGLAGAEVVEVTANAILIRMQPGKSITDQIKTAFDAESDATDLASCEIIGAYGEVAFDTDGPVSLSGGKNKNFALNHNEQTDSGSFLEGNANARVQDLKARGSAEIDGATKLGGPLILDGPDSGEKIGDVQQYLNDKINRRTVVSVASSGFLSWASPNLTAAGVLTFKFPASGNRNTVDLSGLASISDGYSLYVQLNHLETDAELEPVIASALPVFPNVFRIATRVGSALVLFNGAVIYTGESARIGNDGSATSSVNNAVVRRDSSGDFSAHNATLNKAIVGTGAGKGVDVTGAGDMEIGASIGANNMNLGGASSTVIVLGDFIVQGTTTTINTATLDVEDKNITVNKGGNDATSEGAGLTVDRTGPKGSIIYANAAATKFKAGALGSEVEIADISTAQALTNKTIAVASNSITGSASKIAQFSAGGVLEAGSIAPSALLTTASYRAGKEDLTSGDTSKAVTFSSTLGTTSYRLQVQLVNLTDGSPQFMPITITAKSATGFTAAWPAGVDSNNYDLEYAATLDN